MVPYPDPRTDAAAQNPAVDTWVGMLRGLCGVTYNFGDDVSNSVICRWVYSLLLDLVCYDLKTWHQKGTRWHSCTWGRIVDAPLSFWGAKLTYKLFIAQNGAETFCRSKCRGKPMEFRRCSKYGIWRGVFPTDIWGYTQIIRLVKNYDRTPHDFSAEKLCISQFLFIFFVLKPVYWAGCFTTLVLFCRPCVCVIVVKMLFSS